MKSANITKASGEVVPFSKDKLLRSLNRSGAREDTINDIINEVESQLYEGISTREIYKSAFALLKKTSKATAAKYKLKQAIMELGPTGFPFEILVSEILKYQGFDVKVGEIVKGHCVNHEVDVVATKNNKHFMIECKFHNLRGISCDVKVPLYIHSRFQDIKVKRTSLPGNDSVFHQGWVVTNTKFTKDAIQYGECIGLNLIGWDFPSKGGLREMIDHSGLYPVTCMSSISKTEKQLFLEKKIVLCKEILSKPDLLKIAHISEKRKGGIMHELNSLYKE